MKCPFQWTEKTLLSGKEKRRMFRDCDGDCAAYIPDKTIGQFIVPASCRMFDGHFACANISPQAATALERMGANAHGGEKPELLYGSSPCTNLPRKKEFRK